MGVGWWGDWVVRGRGWGKAMRRIRGTYAGAEGEVAAETHARGPDAAVAVLVGEEVVDRLCDILVIRVKGLFAPSAAGYQHHDTDYG